MTHTHHNPPPPTTSTSVVAAFASFAILLLTAACTTPNPNYRRDAGADEDAGPDAGPKSCEPACTGATPVCGAENTCHACTKHSECASNACLPEGACADSSVVAYVDPAGTSSGACTKTEPCSTLAAALTTKKQYVKMTGTTKGNTAIRDQSIAILADTDAKLIGEPGGGTVLTIHSSPQVSIFDLDISGGSAGGYGIDMPTESGSTVTLRRVKIHDNEGIGVGSFNNNLDMTLCTITRNSSGVEGYKGNVKIAQSTITDNLQSGVSTSGGTLDITRSALARNNEGIRMHDSAVFHITNNFIVNNRGTGFKALHLPGSKLEFNTIAGNQLGVDCLATVPFQANNNVILQNFGGTQFLEGASCSHGNSLLTSSSPGFLDPSKGNYRLTAGADNAIIDKAQGACPDTDYDGGDRPLGAGCDLGADEYK